MFVQPINIHITELGPVRNADMEISDLMFFSGESGLGKSYLAVLSHYFFEILLDVGRMASFVSGKGGDMTTILSSFDGKSGAVASFKTSELEEWMAEDAISYLQYMLGNDKLTGKISVRLPDVFPESFTVMYERYSAGLLGNNEDEGFILSIDDVRFRVPDRGIVGEENPLAYVLCLYLCKLVVGNPIGLKSTYEMPPSRGAFLTEKIVPQTGLYIEFQKFLDLINRSKRTRHEPDSRLVGLMANLLDGEVKYEDSKYLFLRQGQSMPISAAAASVRELGAIDLMVKNIEIPVSSILVEEPEAHLHPSKQRLMADVLTLLSNAGASIQITTHSDYFLRRINEHIMLCRIKKIMPEEDFASFVAEHRLNADLALDPEKIRAYLLMREGDHTVLRRQKLDEGVPFSSFCGAIKESLELEEILSEKLEDCRYGDN